MIKLLNGDCLELMKDILKQQKRDLSHKKSYI